MIGTSSVPQGTDDPFTFEIFVIDASNEQSLLFKGTSSYSEISSPIV